MGNLQYLIEKGPKFIDPRGRDHISYFDQLRQYNLGLQERLAETLDDRYHSNYKDNFFIATTGSDGRLEKGPQSKVELIAYTPINSKIEIKDIVNEIIEDDEIKLFDPSVEYKKMVIGKLSLFNEDPNRVFPNRVLDSRFLYGNELLLPLTLRNIADEFTGIYGKRIITKLKDQERYARKISREGRANFQGNELTHVNFEEGIAFYDDEDNLGPKRGSFKYGPMRLIQTSMSKGIIKKIYNKDFDLDILRHYPTNTVDRLHFFETENLSGLNSSEVSDLADNYKWFLWIYHCGQENWRLDKQSKTKFDPEDAKMRVEDTLEIMKGSKIIV